MSSQELVRNQAAEAMSNLIHSTNRLGSDKEVALGIADAIIGAHPTLVASMFRALVNACQDGDLQKKIYYDGRCNSCTGLIEVINEWSDENCIPFV